MKKSLLSCCAAALLALSAVPALAWHLEGRVYCEGTGLPMAGVTLHVTSADGGAPFSEFITTNDIGYYFTWLPDTPRCFRVEPVLGAGEACVAPAACFVEFCTTEANSTIEQSWTISSPRCGKEALCWLTGGGAKFSAVTGGNVGDAGPRHSFGGNVNPGCSPTAGEGGQWNNVAHSLRLHFQGRAIEVLRCGNVDGIPPGSESPVTPFNYIEFQGTGTLKGIKGNKVDMPLVYFWGRCEDRNEPGSNGQRDGTLKDRYFLHVYSNPTDPNGSTLLLVDVDGNPATVDPITITDGNLQIHISSCDSPPDLAFESDTQFGLEPGVTAGSSTGGQQTIEASGRETRVEASLPAEQWLAPASPNPARDVTRLRFGLPRETHVTLSVFDVRGRKVRDVLNARVPAGEHSASWDLRDRSGERVPYGIYFARLTTAGRVLNQTLVLAP